jgi:hypothetical protein
MAIKRKPAKKKTPKKTVKRSPTRVKNAKKAVRKATPKAAPKGKKAAVLKPIGKVTHFFREIKVAIVKFSKPVKKGTTVRFRGATTDFAQKLESLQYEHKVIATAPKGKQIGIKVKKRVREGDKVYPEK